VVGDGGRVILWLCWKDNMMQTRGCGLCTANGGGLKVLASNLSEADGVETHNQWKR